MFLLLKAPFASFRPFQSGSYRSTTPVPSPSAVYGILLNLAGIEQRTATDQPITLIRDDLPEMEIAIGIPNDSHSETSILSQQLHNYPVGASGKELAKKTYGNKYWIAPVRREVLVEFSLIIGVKAGQELCDRIIKGLNGELDEPRYGLAFAGDNNFLFDEIKVIPDKNIPFAKWYCPIKDNTPPSRGICRLTTWIDRADNTNTKIQVFAPLFSNSPPENAWLNLPPSNA
ncbi:CRISPR-associated protein Cas5 [Aphanothece sacrum]|uniref:CRISPR-associated protein DevS n=1 Tax=Aphanothece sacrum FPU1 TaxID=1920663 RepID=A0A401INL9_APHSA|nr:CRISPR-associated protein Cas5 [Aphanothece sacrum]GBF82864.1 CRISPR-associated protein DevS [Aphanothece sacrum FPU1]GBF86259.1 CRISPR-associated protein DevS [Aphanothece sacrum FPU3]